MAKITIDGKEYEIENLPKEAIELINSINFVDGEIQKLSNQIKIYQIARTFYGNKLKEILDTLPNSNDEKLKFS